MHGYARILVPTDFSPCSESALTCALELAQKFGSTVVLMHAYGLPAYGYVDGPGVPTADFLTAVERAAHEAMRKAVAAHQDAHVPIASVLYSGVPWEEVLTAIKQHDVGLVVMGTHGRRGIAHAVMGSVAEKVVRLSPVPVLTVRGTEERAARS